MKKHKLVEILVRIISMPIILIASFVSCILLSAHSHKARIYSIINSKSNFDDYIATMEEGGFFDSGINPKTISGFIHKNTKFKIIDLVKNILFLIVVFLAIKLILFNPSALPWIRLSVLAILVFSFLKGARYAYLNPYVDKMQRAKILSTADWFVEWADGFNDCNKPILNVIKHKKDASTLDDKSVGININHESCIDLVVSRVGERDKLNALLDVRAFAGVRSNVDVRKTIIAMALIFLNKSIDLRDYQTGLNIWGNFDYRNFRSDIDPDIIRFAHFMEYKVSIKTIKKKKPSRGKSQ
ncbi:MAG TPA: hypothetical protein PLD95_03775 [bacterium]|nr:hypothetical protein [bacterium]HOG38561.1 hypothetical protein [bacterium]HQI03437.1 hypothetical protein [bacterium]